MAKIHLLGMYQYKTSHNICSVGEYNLLSKHNKYFFEPGCINVCNVYCIVLAQRRML